MSDPQKVTAYACKTCGQCFPFDDGGRYFASKCCVCPSCEGRSSPCTAPPGRSGEFPLCNVCKAKRGLQEAEREATKASERVQEMARIVATFEKQAALELAQPREP